MKRSLGGGPPPSLDYAEIANAIEKRLFIGKVPTGTTEDELRICFEEYGALTEIRIVPDRGNTGFGIGFVGFATWGAAHRALMGTDGHKQLKGHEGTMTTLSVSFAEQTGRVGRGGGAAYAKGMEVDRIFVGNLPEDTTEEELMFRFGECGAVQGANLLPAKSYKRCGYVNFQVWGEAMDAVEKLHGQPLRANADHMTVVLAQPKDGGAARAAAAAARSGPDLAKVGMDLVTSLAKKRRMDSQPAAGVDLTVLLAAYAAAVNSDGPRSACDILHDQLMQAREQSRIPAITLRDPGLARGGSGGGGGGGGRDGERDMARLFIGGLPHECEDEDLAALANQLAFSVPPHQAALIECRVLPGKGCGYLRYASWEAADEAYNALQGRQVEGWTQVLRVQWASPRDGRTGGPGFPDIPAITAPPVQPVVVGQPQAPLDPICYASQAEVEAQGLEPTRLFIGQIARDVVDANSSLRPVFESFGPLTEFRWVKEKGVLYASYNSFVEAQAAMQGLSARVIPGVSKCLNVKFSTKRYSAH